MNWKILEYDEMLKPFAADIQLRMDNYERKKKELSKESFDELQNKRRESTKAVLSGFEKLSKKEKVEYSQKIKDSIKVSKYERDFVSISSKEKET